MQYKVVVLGGLIGVLLTGILVGFLVTSPTFKKAEEFSLVWHRTGGIAGANDVFRVSPDGFAAYTSRFAGSFNTTLSREALAQLQALIIEHELLRLQPTEFHGKPGAADYFAYELEVTVNGTTKRIVWVDAWAADPPLSPQLANFQNALQAFIKDLTSSVKEIGEDEAGRLASNFIKSTSTFRFDGLSADFTLTGITRITNEPPLYGYTWLVTITYYTAYAGHGDRTGQIHLPIVTKHEAHVGVASNGTVLYGACDSMWDLLHDAPLPLSAESFRVVTVVNDVRKVDVTINVRVSDGVTQQEAETIAITIFRTILGDKVLYRLNSLNYSDSSLQADITGGVDLTDLGHIFHLSLSIPSGYAIVTHCK